MVVVDYESELGKGRSINHMECHRTERAMEVAIASSSVAPLKVGRYVMQRNDLVIV